MKEILVHLLLEMVVLEVEEQVFQQEQETHHPLAHHKETQEEIAKQASRTRRVSGKDW